MDNYGRCYNCDISRAGAWCFIVFSFVLLGGRGRDFAGERIINGRRLIGFVFINGGFVRSAEMLMQIDSIVIIVLFIQGDT